MREEMMNFLEEIQKKYLEIELMMMKDFIKTIIQILKICSANKNLNKEESIGEVIKYKEISILKNSLGKLLEDRETQGLSKTKEEEGFQVINILLMAS